MELWEKVKGDQLFTVLRDFLLVYLSNQRRASSNIVKAYRTTLNQFSNIQPGKKYLYFIHFVLSVRSGMVTYEMVNSYLDWLSAEKNTAPAMRNNRLAAIGIQKNDRFAKVDYMSEEVVKTLLAELDTRTENGVWKHFLMIFLYDTGTWGFG